MHDSENVDNLKGDNAIGGRGQQNFKNKSFKVESSWRLNALTEGTVTIEVGSLFRNLMTRTAKDKFL